MSNRYFIWKEANCQEINSKWVEISGREFYSLLKESPKKRYFEKIDECVEDGADVLVFETTYERYKKWHREHERKCRSKRLELKYKNSIIFLNDYFVSSEGSLNDFIADIDENVEDKALENIECFILQDAIKNLSDEEKLVLNIVKKAMEENKSERGICKELGIDMEKFRYQREKVFKKIKKYFSPKQE